MEIRKSMMEDLPRILALYEQARAFMKANGNPDQWGDSYPEEEIVRQDIEEGRSYVCETDGEIAGVFYFSCEPDPDYARIDDGGWLNDAPYGVVPDYRFLPAERRGFLLPGLGFFPMWESEN